MTTATTNARQTKRTTVSAAAAAHTGQGPDFSLSFFDDGRIPVLTGASGFLIDRSDPASR